MSIPLWWFQDHSGPPWGLTCTNCANIISLGAYHLKMSVQVGKFDESGVVDHQKRGGGTLSLHPGLLPVFNWTAFIQLQ